MCILCASKSQTKNYNDYELPISRGTFQVGIQKSLSFGYTSAERRAASAFKFNPSINYFIINRLSIGLSYWGYNYNMNPSGITNYYHNGEINLKYYIRPKKPFSLYGQVGYVLGQYSPSSRSGFVDNKNQLGSMLKLGVGLSYRLKKTPSLALNVEINNYLNLKRNSQRKISMPDISIGLSFSLPKKKKKKIVSLD